MREKNIFYLLEYTEGLKLQKINGKKKKKNPHFNEIVKQEESSLPNSRNVTAAYHLQNRAPNPHSLCNASNPGDISWKSANQGKVQARSQPIRAVYRLGVRQSEQSIG